MNGHECDSILDVTEHYKLGFLLQKVVTVDGIANTVFFWRPI